MRVYLIFLLFSSISSLPRRTTIETIVETVTRRVVHILQPQCQCSQVNECKKEAMANVDKCFDKCDQHLEKFHSETSMPLTECFSNNMNNAVDADECLFKGMKDLEFIINDRSRSMERGICAMCIGPNIGMDFQGYCRTDNEKKYIIPANFSEAVGFDLEMAPAEDDIPNVAWIKRALEQFNVFQDFFGCTKKCVHREMTNCFAKKKCAVAIPPQETLKPIYEKCHAHTPQMSVALFNTCQCLAFRKKVSSLYGICAVISNPTFIEN